MKTILKRSDVTIDINHSKDNGLFISLETPRLFIRSVQSTDVDNYFSLFSDSEVMKKYATGKPKEDRSYIEDRINGWVDRWKSLEPDPFNGMAVFLKQPDSSLQFIGHIVAGRSERAGYSEVAYLLHEQYWKQVHYYIITRKVSRL